MQQFSPTIIWRHRKENLKKCSLRGLESRDDCLFFTYPKDTLPDLTNYVLLAVDGEVLSEADGKHGLFLIDGTWAYAELMMRQLPKMPLKRSLPAHFKTAYPRKQDEEHGLASVEALYLAYLLTGRNTEGLLDNYHWKASFLEKNGLTGP